MSYLVGEQGPELVTFRAGGRVDPPGTVRLLRGERVVCRACAMGHHLECEDDRCGCDDPRG